LYAHYGADRRELSSSFGSIATTGASAPVDLQAGEFEAVGPKSHRASERHRPSIANDAPPRRTNAFCAGCAPETRTVVERTLFRGSWTCVDGAGFHQDSSPDQFNKFEQRAQRFEFCGQVRVTTIGCT
jgi:hypothetical protein